ncbi:MAG: BrnA antitoxin family protein [Acidobacteria bacterium]|nr:BrnA antitoxin family protein [Acidobacteriota bacterium]
MAVVRRGPPSAPLQSSWMRERYDFSAGRRNPYVKRLKRQGTIRLDQDTIDYFKNLSTDTGIPYQTLINLYLRDCATNGRKLAALWDAPAGPGAT